MNHIPAFNEVFKVLSTDREVCIRERSEESCDNFDSEQGPMSGLQFWITLGFINIIKILFNWYHYHHHIYYYYYYYYYCYYYYNHCYYFRKGLIPPGSCVFLRVPKIIRKDSGTAFVESNSDFHQLYLRNVNGGYIKRKIKLSTSIELASK